MYQKKYDILFFVAPWMKKKNHEILTALHFKPLYNINRTEKWGKKYTNRGL
jgi:hypothetical protein